jgi:hypothetical protein
MFSINPDAHSIAELDLMRWDLAMARKEAGRVRDTTTWCGRVGIVQVTKHRGPACVSQAWRPLHLVEFNECPNAAGSRRPHLGYLTSNR